MGEMFRWMALVLLIRFRFLFGVLQPLDELLHLLQEVHLALGRMTVLVPLENRLLGHHVRFVEQQNDLVEGLHEVHVLVAELLHLEDQRQLGAIDGAERLQQSGVLAQMLERLLGDQLLLFVPFGQAHDGRPDDAGDLVLGNVGFLCQLFDIRNDLLLGLVVADLVEQCLEIR